MTASPQPNGAILSVLTGGNDRGNDRANDRGSNRRNARENASGSEPEAPTEALALERAVTEAAAARASGEDRTVELGRFQLLRTLGRGGMGLVFEAWDPQLERHVAIKLLLRGGASATLDEARCLARVAHPNVVAVHEFGRVGELVYIAMELVDGSDFRRWLRAQPRAPGEVIEVVLAVGRALAAVHDAGLLHGDVKPGNVLIGADGRVRVADFGLARVGPNDAPASASGLVAPEAPSQGLDDLVRRAVAAVELEFHPERNSAAALAIEGLRSLLGQSDRCGGTVPYMPPERLQGRSGGPAADQYSLCATAWEALHGVVPFGGRDRQAVLTQVALGSIQRGREVSREVSPEVEAVLLRGLSERPEDRWPSVDELCSALERAHQRRSRVASAVRRAFVAGALVLGTAGLGAGALAVGPAFGSARCDDEGRAVAARWNPDARAALEQRFITAKLPFPRSEASFVGDRLDAWVADWTALWGRACVADPAVRRCLEHERERFTATLELLEVPASAFELEFGRSAQVGADRLLGAARTLVVELGSPSHCLDARHEPGDFTVEQLPLLAELSSFERRLELAVVAGAFERAAFELARFDEMLAEHEGELRARDVDLRRLSIEPWRARVIAQTDPVLAHARLRAGLREAERLGADELRFALLLTQLKLSVGGSGSGPGLGLGVERLDDLAALDGLAGLAERVKPGPVARAELALVRADLTSSPARSGLDVVELDAAFQELELLGQPHTHLRFELALRRAWLHFEAGDPRAALAAGEQAAEVGQVLYNRTNHRLVPALVIAGLSGAVLGECDHAKAMVAELWAVSEGSDAHDSAADWGGINPSKWTGARLAGWSQALRACPYAGADLQTFLESRS
jgi:hypothetical protein